MTNKIVRKIFKLIIGKKDKTLPRREPSDYIVQMELYKKITEKNPINVDVVQEIKNNNTIGLFIKRNTDRRLWHNIWPLLDGKTILYIDDDNWDQADIYIISGIGRGVKSYLERLYYIDATLYTIDENFFKSILPFSKSKTLSLPEIKKSNFFLSASHIVDCRGVHFYPGIITQLEHRLNSNEELTKAQIDLSQRMIDKIVQNNLSKYNFQPITTPKIIDNDRKNILIIDQAYRDFSVVLSGGNEASFKYMLERAIIENPDANIIIKTHVDKDLTSTYYSKMPIPKDVTLYTDEINPMSLISLSDKVYCYSSAIGWESLLLGKEVHVFGSPIYSGWGLTKDRRNFSYRRKRTRTLNELFYYIYIKHSFYIDIETGKECKIDDAIESLLKMRELYFNTEMANK